MKEYKYIITYTVTEEVCVPAQNKETVQTMQERIHDLSCEHIEEQHNIERDEYCIDDIEFSGVYNAD